MQEWIIALSLIHIYLPRREPEGYQRICLGNKKIFQENNSHTNPRNRQSGRDRSGGLPALLHEKLRLSLIHICYFAQNQASLLDENLTVFQTIDDVAQGDIRNKIKDLLGAFMFGGENSAKKGKVLSGGERTRLAMIKLLLEPVNLLILDEPTNHLDMKTKDILKQALLDFDGTLIVVSHDRDFLDGLVTKVYEFGNQRVTEHLEGIYEFLQRKKMENLDVYKRQVLRYRLSSR